jgi:DNA-binding PadR family transcriptional regulator
MWIEVMLLSKLARGPSHGYELRKEVEASTGHTLSNNSLYPTLRRFVDAGAVTRSAEEQVTKPPRHVYAITDVGRERLPDMIADFPAELALNDSEFLMRVGNFGWLLAEEQQRVLDVRDQAVVAKTDQLDMLASAQADPWTRAVLDEVCRRFTAERAWLAELRDRIDSGEMHGGEMRSGRMYSGDMAQQPGEVAHDQYREPGSATAVRPAQRAGRGAVVRDAAPGGPAGAGDDAGR